MLHKVITIRHKDGLRARPAALLVKTANAFASQITIEKGNKRINTKSIMGVLSLGVQTNGDIHLIFSGDDEQAAMEAVTAVIERNFRE
jgi:phosphotransferase system HPr (HPr) family protein